MRKFKAAELVIDYDVYPRNNIDAHNVRTIADAILAGVKMPPVIIDKRTKRVIDGVHRTKAVLLLDDNGEIDCIEKQFKSERELFIEAARLNACHGARLDPCDRAKCCIIAEKLGIDMDVLAGALNMPVDKLAKLHVNRTAKTSGGLQIPLKRTFQHMQGRRLTKPQIEVNARSSGWNQVFYANQLIDMIEADLLDKEDEKLFERLQRLHELLEELMVSR